MTEFEKKFKEKTGDNFNDYYKKYKPKLTWYLTKYTKDLEKADEFANMAFVQGLEKIDTYNKELSQFITWLTSIAINIVIKDYKDRKKHDITSLDDELKEKFTLTSILSYGDDSHAKALEEENIEKSKIIKNVINSLPEKYKKVMIMRELDKMSYKDIANNIIKEKNIIISNNICNIIIDEHFKSISIKNNGQSNIKIDYNSNNIILEPCHEKEIIKEEINDDMSDINIFSENSTTDINIKETTNLSTIKSQIKKGRYLIRKKVKREFEMIDKHGIIK